MPFRSNSWPNSEVGGGMERRETASSSPWGLSERNRRGVDHHRAKKGRGGLTLSYGQSNKLPGGLRGTSDDWENEDLEVLKNDPGCDQRKETE